jgi:hypothetical protein
MESEKPPKRPINFGEAGRKVDEEIEEFIRWFNDDIVPSLRHRSTRALRAASSKLAELADLMEKNKDRS